MNMKNAFLFILSIIFLTQYAVGQKVQTRLDSTSFLIGDQAKLEVQLLSNKKWSRVDFLQMPIEEHEALELAAQSSTFVEEENNQVSYTRYFLVGLFDTGAYYIPSMPVVISEGGRRDTFYSNTIPIVVRPVAADSVALAPNKPIILEPWHILDIKNILIPLLIGLALVTWFVWNRKNKKKQRQAILEIPKTPYELAQLELEEHENKGLDKKGLIKEHFAGLSIILRSYLERQFQFPAAESTTREIRYGLDKTSLDMRLNQDIEERLMDIDLIKYAKAKPSDQKVHSSFSDVSQLINRIHTQVKRNINEEEE